MEDAKVNTQIPNFQPLLKQSSSGNQFEVHQQWFIIQRKIISEVYGEFDSLHTFKIYLYLCKYYNFNSGRTERTKNRINNDLKYTKTSANGKPKYPMNVRRSLEWLEKTGFIKRVSSDTQSWYRSKILVAPDYHPAKKQFFACPELQLDFQNLKDHNQGYIRLPQKAIKDSMLANTTLAKREWTERKLKTLILLYAHCWLEYFGGIDPAVVAIDPNGAITLDEGFCYTLKRSTKDITKTVISLIKDGLFQPVRCLFEDGIYTGDVGTYHPTAKTIERVVLRPTHLISSTVESEAMKNKKGKIIL
ncbi:hypothetical protein M4D70_17360 [Brevibacillus borstelensis]|uniref:hypothetical protein n=1 Tax=Brevibacillus borstelensis TaxID=45462 RepID=UPI002040E96A|nr:hypothetical protein [Brevibacillus borstelensis]MCM3623997.1 hypothetical protein [Brevibacillus borstelensis]